MENICIEHGALAQKECQTDTKKVEKINSKAPTKTGAFEFLFLL
ncbi:hypothetical protein LEP1GSC188_1959 [Leptospira weilii serovar Topaz str. LT2116]|uniref:Uncharacterized protein n=1 Tax=Leptospira weilii serovar Topaz str. LT2116 TaxID=1088540 RepID=M3H3M7_9LEPT|nr:hypothetical protein LEP1GSC188_1959 [Leptospira weilii serovar Topaz str. LT2116]